MCPRLIRLLRALDGVGVISKPGKPIVPNGETICQNSRKVATAFMQEHESLCSSWFVGQTSSPTDGDLTQQPLELADYEFLHFLVMAEHYSRESVKLLPSIKGIESDPMGLTPPSKTALRWIVAMNYIATKFRLLLSPDALEYHEVVQQQIRLTPALDKFLQLASNLGSCIRVWKKQPADYLSWPSLEKLENFDPDVFSPISDIVTCLETVQALLKKQDETRGRKRRDNYVTAREVVARAFQKSSRVLAIRLDLGYRKGVFQGKAPSKNMHQTDESQLNIDSIKKSFNVFILHLYKEFDRLHVEYVAKMEYGLKKGYHYHLLILINGQKHQRDVIHGKMLGNYWVQVATGGEGVYWNCNARKETYRYCGIGMIYRDNEEKRKFLDTKVVHYLVKYDLPFELMKVPGSRKFWTSKEKGERRKAKRIRLASE